MLTIRSRIGWRVTRAAARVLEVASRIMGSTAPLGIVAQQNADALRRVPRQDAEQV